MQQTLATIQENLSIPWAYGRFLEQIIPPFIVYLGNGQNNFEADNTYYYKQKQYQLEYYFTKKDETIEASIENYLLEDGWLYEKSEDIYLEDEDVFLIYYYI